MKYQVQVNQPETLVVRQVMNMLNEEISKAVVQTDFFDIRINKYEDGTYVVNDTKVFNDSMVIQYVEEILLSERVEMVQEILYSDEGGVVNINTSGLQPIVVKVTPLDNVCGLVPDERHVRIDCIYYDQYRYNKILTSYSFECVSLNEMNCMIIGDYINQIFYNSYIEYTKQSKVPDNRGRVEVRVNPNYFIDMKDVELDLHGVANESALAMAVLAMEDIKVSINRLLVNTMHKVVLNGEPIYQ